MEKNEYSNLEREELEESMTDLPNGRELQPENFQNQSGIGELGCN